MWLFSIIILHFVGFMYFGYCDIVNAIVKSDSSMSKSNYWCDLFEYNVVILKIELMW